MDSGSAYNIQLSNAFEAELQKQLISNRKRNFVNATFEFIHLENT